MAEHHEDSEYIEAIREENHATADIADAVGVTRQAADERLRKLEADDEVTKETVGNSLYWTVGDGG